MPFTVTDTTCGHPVIAADCREHATEQARLADTAGYPTRIEEWETLYGLDVAPPADCQRCWHRLADTLDLMQRTRVADAAIAAFVDPFHAVYAFDAIRIMNPALRAWEIAEGIIEDVIPRRARAGMLRRYTAPDEIPGWVLRRVGTP